MEIKEATPSDYDNLVEFWNQNSGWDQIGRSVWEDRFINAPYGPSIIFFIESGGEIVAHMIFVLLKINLGDKEYKGCRPFAPIVSNTIKGSFGIKYITQLLKHGFRNMRNRGTDLLIMVPDPRWRRLFLFTDLVLCDFPLYKLPINNNNTTKEYGTESTKAIDYDDKEINDLWDKVKRQNVYMILRDQQIIKWKNSHRDYKLIGVYQEESLIGIATYLEKPQDKQIQICDVLVPDEKSQKMFFTQISSFINEEYCDNPDFMKMVILVPELFKENLITVGYTPDDYQFLFAIKRLNKKDFKKALNISNWYVSAND